MSTGTLTKYSASAGSGKTFSLTSIYLSHLFREKESYRKILAVTFTNKATSEMKSRILEQLHILSTGGKSEYLKGLVSETGKSEEEIRKRAGELLHTILHDFTRFSVCTIDAFFQKIIRAFARESGLHSGFNIELDHSLILSSAVDEMIASSADDNELKEWLNEYVNSKLSDEKSWNPRDEIMALAEELFKERFKILSTEERSRLEDKKFLLEYIGKLRAIRKKFEETLFDAGKECDRIFTLYSLTDDMFYYKGNGVPGFVHALASRNMAVPKTHVRAIMGDPPKWSTKAMAPELQEAIAAGLDKTLRDAIRYYDDNLVSYNSANEILSNIYSVGILSDILKKVRLIASSENSFLISDAGEFLHDITADDQAPFIYEKIGNRYEHYMIDEFQDTSRIQWDNFFPLIEESMGRGNDNLVVGDIKQSIYRFRNSDWRILGLLLDRQIPEERLHSIPLDTNYRSRSNIIRFNNTLFTLIPENIDSMFSADADPVSFKEIYSEAVQKDPGRDTGGYVRIDFIDNDYESVINKSGKETDKPSRDWKEKVLEKLPSVIELFQDKGYSASDIGIIVRSGREGTDVLNMMIRHSNNSPDEKKSRYNYNIVSDYSLTLSNSHAITFIISVLKVLNNSRDDVSRAAILRFYLLATGSADAENVPLDLNALRDGSHGLFPAGYGEFMERASHLSLFEAIENIISFFGLGSHPWNVAYLNTFQDLVIGFSGTKDTDLRSFLDWWETTGTNKSVVLPANQDAARIFTIHKVKGLEFRVIILPFLSWNDDHDTHHREIVWVKPPDVEPFNDLGIVPIRYRRDPLVSIFNEFFRQEKYSAYLDNLNLLYVAMTRAQDAIYGFAAEKPDINSGISKLLKDALTSYKNPAGKQGIEMKEFYNAELRIFELGEMAERKRSPAAGNFILTSEYKVCQRPDSLRLKLHGENYFIATREEVASRINYGKLMHRAFEFIDTIDDITGAVGRLVLEGLIPLSESESMTYRLRELISMPAVADWFLPGNRILKEAEILTPSGTVKRPDRVIVRDGKAVIIDFKFGEENAHYADQILQYRDLLIGMGYRHVEGYLWYVDRNKITEV
ncbi:MAG: UvrD-helicase domain-containing protein [Bacteroidales bacterium]|jgi:ATP-dependent exoDNAse (exonuclease V) beta subunit|nr:UvrD-helicase domain-containing protein [Bacteroidales bacterium]